jgi:hypothetical protein
MSNYFVELPGALSLEDQSKAIEGEEALGTQFVNAHIWVNSSNEVTNLAAFKELDEAPDPPLGKPKLAKTLSGTPEWAGPLIVQGTAVQKVYLLRS